MANPLKMLELKQQAVQFIQEVPINAAPKKVWASLLHPSSWFQFDPDPAKHSKHSFELKPGALWTAENADGSAVLMGTVTYYEPGKLLRIAGPLGMTHLPVNSVIIFELQPEADGKSTLLRVGTRMMGFMDGDIGERFKGGWQKLLGSLKAASEK
ncbi:MAG TPA: SRPBCC domain-containing protein [Phycisphaerae bacterium]|jgi:uncharacterized protein YndB with AHSA1/START domain|nr:SRPBCC domain-containing protein [Phycisphaerae bacterium]